MEKQEAKKILEHVWDFTNPESENCGDLMEKAVHIAINAIEAIESITEIITEAEAYHVSTHGPSQEDYDKVAAEKFHRILKTVSKAKILERLSPEERGITKRFTKNQLLAEAELIEECGENLYPSLIGYSPNQLRDMASVIED